MLRSQSTESLMKEVRPSSVRQSHAVPFEYPETLPGETPHPAPVAVCGWRPSGRDKSSSAMLPPPSPSILLSSLSSREKKANVRSSSSSASSSPSSSSSAPQEPDLTTRPNELPMRFVEQKVSTAEYGKAGLDKDGRFVDWTTQRTKATVLLKLSSKALLSRLVIRNRNTSILSIRLGLSTKKGTWMMNVLKLDFMQGLVGLSILYSLLPLFSSYLYGCFITSHPSHHTANVTNGLTPIAYRSSVCDRRGLQVTSPQPCHRGECGPSTVSVCHARLRL